MDATSRFKLLFCLLNNKVSGGNRILLELANRSHGLGSRVDVHFRDGSGHPLWFDNFSCDLVDVAMADSSIVIKDKSTAIESTIQDSSTTNETRRKLESYDFIFVSNLSLLPMILPYCNYDKVVLISQGFESYCYGDTPAALFSPKQSLEAILRLPMRIIATSKSIQALLQDKVGRSSYMVPVSVERRQFARHQPIDRASLPKRILAVGDYQATFKGIFDLADALEIVAKDLPVQLVLLTQQKSARHRFDKYSFPVEFHHCPAQSEIAAIYASCHAYCCSSWYEGFGLPCLEAFSVGIPVISTDNYGVTDFAQPDENILIAPPNSPKELAEAVQRLMLDDALASRLIKNGDATVSSYTWDQTLHSFFKTLDEISGSPSVHTGSTDRDEMQQLLHNLETDGFFTPAAIEHELIAASSQLEKLCKLVRAGSIPNEAAGNSLRDIREQLQKHLGNPRASYYKEFKARFDFCQLLSSFEDQGDWQKLINSADR